MRQDSLYPHPERLVFFFGNHDVKRFLSEPGATPQKLKLAFALLATLRGMPEIYSGDEIAMLGGDDPDNRRDFPGGFSQNGDNGFAASTRTTRQQEIFAWASELFHLRAQHPALQSGEQQNVLADETTLAYVRSLDTSHGCESDRPGDRVFVVINKAAASRQISIPTAGTALEGCNAFDPLQAAGGPSVTVESHSISLVISPNSAVLYEAR